MLRFLSTNASLGGIGREHVPAARKFSASQSVVKAEHHATPSRATDENGPSTSGALGLLPATAVLSAMLTVAAPTGLLSAPAAIANTDVVQQAVAEYSDMEVKGKFSKNVKALDEFRAKYSIKRTLDGRVMLKSKKGDWFSVRLDMEVPGSLLLRDPNGSIFAVQTETLQQIDLSDDYVLLLMFSDGDWEDQMTAIEFTDTDGKTKQLKLDEREFREVVGILKEAGEEVEAAAAAGLGRK